MDFVGDSPQVMAASSKAASQSPDAATSDISGRTTFAGEILCGKHGRFRCELYDFEQTKTDFAGGHRFWHLRWLVDFLGGTSATNFLGQAVDAWTNRVVDKVQWLMSDCEAKEIEQEAAKHILYSSWAKQKSTMSKKKRKLNDSDGPDSNVDPGPDTSMGTDGLMCQEFAASTFAFLVIVGHWAFRGPKQTQKWNLGHDNVKDRCFTLLNAMMDQFLQGDRVLTTPEGIEFHFRAGLVDIHRLSKSHMNLSRSFSGLDQWATVMDAIHSLAKDEVNGNFAKSRRTMSSLCIARCYEHLAAVIDCGSRSGHPVWTSITIKQVDQLRTESTFGVVIIA